MLLTKKKNQAYWQEQGIQVVLKMKMILILVFLGSPAVDASTHSTMER